MKTIITLCEFYNIALKAGFQDLFDLNVSDIVESGSFSDLTGDRILEFTVIEMNDDDLDIIIEFDDEKYAQELINPREYSEVLDEEISYFIYENCKEIKLSFNNFQKIKNNPGHYMKHHDSFYVKTIPEKTDDI